jgi:hypothetical protein
MNPLIFWTWVTLVVVSATVVAPFYVLARGAER